MAFVFAARPSSEEGKTSTVLLRRAAAGLEAHARSSNLMQPKARVPNLIGAKLSRINIDLRLKWPFGCRQLFFPLSSLYSVNLGDHLLEIHGIFEVCCCLSNIQRASFSLRVWRKS